MADINPDFWLSAIRTSALCTDCDAKTRALQNAAEHLECYIQDRKDELLEARALIVSLVTKQPEPTP